MHVQLIFNIFIDFLGLYKHRQLCRQLTIYSHPQPGCKMLLVIANQGWANSSLREPALGTADRINGAAVPHEQDRSRAATVLDVVVAAPISAHPLIADRGALHVSGCIGGSLMPCSHAALKKK